MITAGVKEIKNNLSRYLAQVKAGEEVMITKRGKPVARIIQEGRENMSIKVSKPSRRILNNKHETILKIP